MHLRRCVQCGHVGCCDSSKHKHATKHFHTTRHPVVKSFEPGEDWLWCYLDQMFAEAAELEASHDRDQSGHASY